MCGSSLTEFKSSNSVENLFEAELSTWIFEKSLKNHFLSQTSFLILLWNTMNILPISETFSTFFLQKILTNTQAMETD